MKKIKSIPALFICGAVLGAFSASAADNPRAKNKVLQRANGAKAWAQNCGRCHNLRAPSELSDEEWEVSATHMRVRANLPGDMVRDIILFLQSSNDKKGQ